MPSQSKQMILLIAYSADAGRRLAASIEGEGEDVVVLDARDPAAPQKVQCQEWRAVVLDCSPRDVNVAQARRQLGQMLPGVTVLTVSPGHVGVGVYCRGHKVSAVESLRAALSLRSAA